jgi:hypothetical protein
VNSARRGLEFEREWQFLGKLVFKDIREKRARRRIHADMRG